MDCPVEHRFSGVPQVRPSSGLTWARNVVSLARRHKKAQRFNAGYAEKKIHSSLPKACAREAQRPERTQKRRWPTLPVSHICLPLADVRPFAKAANTNYLQSPKGAICLSRAREHAVRAIARILDPLQRATLDQAVLRFSSSPGYQSFPALPISLVLPFVHAIHPKTRDGIGVPAVPSARKSTLFDNL